MYRMKEFICEICEYKTIESYNFERHMKSFRHQKKATNRATENEMLSNVIGLYSHYTPNEIGKSYTCDNCGYNTTHRSNFSRHKKLCSIEDSKEKELIIKLQYMEKEKELANVREEMAQKEIHLLQKQQQIHEQHVDLLRKLIASSYRGSNGSVTSTLYEHYSNNPPLKQIDYMKLNNLIKPKSKLVKEMISCFNHTNLHEFLGSFILDIYKKKNYSEQSIFSTDTSRLNYVIKENIHDNTSEWVPDKKGLKTIEYIIKPLTNHVLDLLKEFNSKLTIGENLTTNDLIDLNRRKQDILLLETYIEDGRLVDKINKYICPFFVMDKNTIKSLDKKKKLLSLDSIKFKQET